MNENAFEINGPFKIKVQDLDFSYGNRPVLNKVSARFERNKVTAILGPSGTGKSTFLLTLNRLWESIPGARMSGRVEIELGGEFQDVYSRNLPVTQLRRAVGMVFQVPNPLPMSIYKNIAFPLKLAGETDRKAMGEKVERALKRAFLWDEVKDRLRRNAFDLSGGQQQRLCIARALVLEPEVLLLDEPTSSLDFKAVEAIERLLTSLKDRCTMILVSHYIDQVKRIADEAMEMPGGA
jgi:phosphate transport system ATP-binding protein